MSTYPKYTLGVDAARRMIEASVARATAMGKLMSIAVVDSDGGLIAFHRMDGAPAVSVQTSQDKAYSAAAARRATHAWEEMFEQDSIMSIGVPAGIDRIIVFGGGFPVTVDGEVVGGIGASGAHFRDDMQIAQAGIDALFSDT